MKEIKKYIILIICLLIINGCDNPVPTELVQDEEQLEVEVITKDIDDEFYEADSSGVVGDYKRFTNIISVSGIKITHGDTTLTTSYAQAIFFDRGNPILRGNGNILSYRTRLLGNVKFNDVEAKRVSHIIRYREGGVVKDVNLGLKHVLNSAFPGNDFNYQFNASVSFDLDFLLGNTVSFNIPTPTEVFGNVKFEGERGNENLKTILNWNAENLPGFEIVISARERDGDKVLPLYRIKTSDDGELILPAKLINEIPIRFKRIIFNFVRKYDSLQSGNNNQLYVLSQSIHSVVIDIP